MELRTNKKYKKNRYLPDHVFIEFLDFYLILCSRLMLKDYLLRILYYSRLDKIYASELNLHYNIYFALKESRINQY